ncbi:peroxisomal membrane protein 11C isoform X2 [Periplaneta americana]|uniref:peroxisomal membrane protein 11C isoform X2 n=1 Tax=Periplaneta americana TaxID=6978 RepID=UPI0037E8504C
MHLAHISKFLNSHSGRDKVMRTLSYTTKLAETLVTSEESATKLRTISAQLSACRTVLRLFDDIPMLHYTLTYGLGNEEPDKISSILGVLTNVADQLYFPLEHVAWAADHRLVSFRSTYWWTASTTCWAMSLYFSLLKTLRSLGILEYHKRCLKGIDGEANVAMAQLLAQQRSLLFTAIRYLGDLAQAVHYLPEGILWGGKLEKWHCGVLGLVTSLIGIYQSYDKIINNSS